MGPEFARIGLAEFEKLAEVLHMKHRTLARRKSWVLAAAATLALGGTALAQYRVGTDGRALEANNRIGSNGMNVADPGQQKINQGNYINNDLITGNITGGKQFRGFVPYSSPDAFRGTLAGSETDKFIAQSSAAPYGGVPQNNAQVTKPFYCQSYGAPPPPGFVEQGPGSGAFVPAAASTGPKPGDLRMGESLGAPASSLPQPGQFFMPGPVDPNTQTSTVISASPLYGARQWNQNSAAYQSFMTDNAMRNSLNAQGQRMDAASIQRMRDEVTQAQTPQGINPTGTPDDDSAQSRQAFPQALSNSMSNGMETPRNRSLADSSAIRSNRGLDDGSVSGDLYTGANVRQQPRLLIAPERQSTQYADLKRRLRDNTMARAIDANNANDTTATQTAPAGTTALPGGIKPMDSTGTTTSGAPRFPGDMTGRGVMPPLSGAGTAAAMPDSGAAQPNPNLGGPTPIAPVNPAPGPAARREAPLQIRSLADGMQAKGLSDLIKEGESQMKQGHYNSAIEQFDLAEQVAPNNPLIMMDRAIAELGQSYYGRAEQHIRQAFMADQALLMAQYDLRELLGNDRLDFLASDLRQMADANQKEARHPFLLAFLAYNTGNERRAAAFLDLAEKRTNGKDELYPLIRKHWALPEDAQPNMNK
jgi:hypothetical protein